MYRSCSRVPGLWRFSLKKDDPILVSNLEEQLREKLELRRSAIPERIAADSEAIENGLAKLVLSIVELVRQLLERQAIRRMDAGRLSEQEIEQVGLALMKLEEKMEEMKQVFGLTSEDLNLSLGPIHTIE
jgi:gas vesicle protein GvpK